MTAPKAPRAANGFASRRYPGFMGSVRPGRDPREVLEEIHRSDGQKVKVAITDVDRFTEPHIGSVVAYLDGVPSAAAQLLLSHGIGGVYWVGTVESARGKGLGEVVTRAVTNRAFELGAAAVTLQASSMGEPIYARLGYETLYRYHGLVRWEPTSPPD